MSGKPFKMKGSPFQRNFGIGRTESPDAITPAKGLMEGLGKIDLKGAAQAALSQLPGGKIAGSEETTGYEKNKDGSLKVDKDGNPIPIKTEKKSESKPYTVKDMFANVKDFLNPKKEPLGNYDPSGSSYMGSPQYFQALRDASAANMKGSPAKHGPYMNPNNPTAPHGHDNWKGKKKKKK